MCVLSLTTLTVESKCLKSTRYYDIIVATRARLDYVSFTFKSDYVLGIHLTKLGTQKHSLIKVIVC